MRRTLSIMTLVLLMLGSSGCGYAVSIGPRLEVGPMEEFQEEIPREGVEEARIEIRFGAGEITLAAGDPTLLFSGQFRTNVSEWTPEVSWRNEILRIEQGQDEEITVGIPGSGAKNEWDLQFSPEVPLDMDVEIGASRGELDLTGLALTRLSLQTGASDLVVQFGAPSPVQMDDLSILAGAANLRVEGIGNANPERVTVRGGAGSLNLDLSGAWTRSARMTIESGVGSLTLRLPENVGLRVEVAEGLGSVEADEGLTRSGDAYVNEAYGETDVELLIEITVGVGNVELQSVGE